MKYDFKTRVNRKEQGSIKWEDMFNKRKYKRQNYSSFYCRYGV